MRHEIKPLKGAEKGNFGKRIGSALSSSAESFKGIIGVDPGGSDLRIHRAVVDAGRSLNSILDEEGITLGSESLLSSGGFTGEVLEVKGDGTLKMEEGLEGVGIEPYQVLTSDLIMSELQAPIAQARDDLFTMSRGKFGPLTLVQKDMLESVIQRLQKVEALQTELTGVMSENISLEDLHPESVMFQDLLEDVLGQVREEGMSRDISLRLEMPDMGVVVCDPSVMKQALNNFLFFALRSSRSGGVVTAGGLSDGKEMCLWVRLKGASVAGGQGLNELRANLNLATVRKLVTSHAGRVWSESDSDKDDLHFITVPFTEGEPISEEEYYGGLWDYQI
ncbi:MAG: hypothetical protein KAH57_07010 [Thermoplasmata archaeon]|nr:hypothetical protein [Thermoplasmata archaeon]